jgi:hypothetical protein
MSMTDLADRNDVDTDARFATSNVVKDRPELAPHNALPVPAKPLGGIPREETPRKQGVRLGWHRRLFKNRFGRRRDTVEYRLPDGAGMLGRNDFDPMLGRRI